MQVQQTRYSIQQIVDRIRKGKLALPEFQRDFVWSPSQICDLLNSISKEWPIGTLLLLNGPQPFAFRAVDTAPPIHYDSLNMYVLDGQQRVTAIFHAAANVSEYVFYIDFRALADSPDQDPVVFSKRHTFEKSFPDIVARSSAGKALCAEIFDSEKFHLWLSHIENRSEREKYLSIRERTLSGLNLKSYFLYAMELEQEIELEALAKIFETINKTGVRLNAFDLLVAKLYPSGFNLKDEWDSLKDEHPILEEMNIDGIEIVKLIALIVRYKKGRSQSSGVRQGDILRMDPDLISSHWKTAASTYLDALMDIRRFGIITPDLVPNWSMVLLVAAKRFFDFNISLDFWWRDAIIRQKFSQAANTRILTEFDWMARSDEVPRDFPLAGDVFEILNSNARSNGILLRGIAGLLIAHGARDPLTGIPLIEGKEVSFLELREDGAFRNVSREAKIVDVFICEKSSAARLRKIHLEDVEIDTLQDQGYRGGDRAARIVFLGGLFE